MLISNRFTLGSTTYRVMLPGLFLLTMTVFVSLVGKYCTTDIKVLLKLMLFFFSSSIPVETISDIPTVHHQKSVAATLSLSLKAKETVFNLTDFKSHFLQPNSSNHA